MTITAKVPPPVPPNSNMNRAMFVWVPQVGGASDPLGSDANMQALLNFCGTNGVNVLYLDLWRYLGGGNWDASNAHAATVAKFIHWAHASGIRVYALCGDTGWGTNQQWVAGNIARNLAQFDALAKTGAITNEAGSFDGLLLDVEYWTGAYSSTDCAGLLDLVKALQDALAMPVGLCATQWQADPTSAAIDYTYDGVTQLEGLHMVDVADFVVVMCYSNVAATQVAMFQHWYDYASATGRNRGLYCASCTMSGLGSESYAGGTKATMEAAHTTISTAFTSAPNDNMVFLGQAVQEYASYSVMS